MPNVYDAYYCVHILKVRDLKVLNDVVYVTHVSTKFGLQGKAVQLAYASTVVHDSTTITRDIGTLSLSRGEYIAPYSHALLSR
jgi:hypothetical protein